jgi:hypothetical protein
MAVSPWKFESIMLRLSALKLALFLIAACARSKGAARLFLYQNRNGLRIDSVALPGDATKPMQPKAVKEGYYTAPSLVLRFQESRCWG